MKVSRYLALYVAQGGWVALGLFLYSDSFWPSTCTPDNVLDIYLCSPQLPESGGWREGALLTWLWSTPILIALEVSRRLGQSKD